MKLMTALAAAGLSTLLVGVAHADILPTVGSPTVGPSGTGTTFWTYDVFVTSTQLVKTGDFFTIYDFAGLTGTPTGPAGFTPSVNLVSPPVVTPVGTVFPNDDPGLPNVTFTYAGPTILGGPTSLGRFTLESLFSPPGVLLAFAGRGTDQGTGLANGNVTNTFGPSSDLRPPFDVPEPGTYAFGVLAAGSILGLMARKRRKA